MIPSPNSLSSNWFATLFYGLTGTLGIYLVSWLNIDRAMDGFRATRDLDNVFDFVVVGAGSAGSLVASRLAETYKVLLLERGGDPHPFTEIPSFSTFLLNYPEVDYSFKSIPQKNACLALNNKQSSCNSGKSLGGSSNSGYLVYSRGNPNDYDSWSNVSGDSSWKYKNLLKYFKKFEGFVDDPKEIHGRKGEVKIQVPPYIGMADYFLRAATELGYSNSDNTGLYSQGIGFEIGKYTSSRGKRHSAFNAFIKPGRDSKRNLFVYKYATVKKILFKEDDNSAYAVEYERHGEKKYAFASKEIIISAGTFNSPHLLIHSGIGPKLQLQEFKIPVKADLPVGQNLQDHISTFLGSFFVKKPITAILDRDMTFMQFLEFQLAGRGKLTTSGIQAFGSIPSAEEPNKNWPDLTLIAFGVGGYKNAASDFAHAFNGNVSYMEPYFQHAIGHDSFDIIVSVGRPKSKGELILNDINFDHPLLIDPKYFEDERDIKVIVEGMKKAIQMIENTTTFGEIGGRFTKHSFPGCESHLFKSDSYLECYARHKTISLNHFVGTNSMGKIGDKRSVVDSTLKVIGVTGLRVIDASVMPEIPLGFTESSTYVIAEKGADMIKEEWKNYKNDKTIEKIDTKQVLNLEKT